MTYAWINRDGFPGEPQGPAEINEFLAASGYEPLSTIDPGTGWVVSYPVDTGVSIVGVTRDDADEDEDGEEIWYTCDEHGLRSPIFYCGLVAAVRAALSGGWRWCPNEGP